MAKKEPVFNLTASWPECFKLPFKNCEYPGCSRRGYFVDKTDEGKEVLKCRFHTNQIIARRWSFNNKALVIKGEK
jgi:hypothetical protein